MAGCRLPGDRQTTRDSAFLLRHPQRDATILTEDLRYPVGRHQQPQSLTPEQRRTAIETVAAAPAHLRTAISGLDDRQLDTPYRPDGWTVRQVVHHMPDAHVNAYTRFKLALTEDNPVIKPYDAAKWAQLEDSKSTPIVTSLALLDAVHDRWLRILGAMSAADFARTIDHPENGVMNLDQVLALYEWHGRNHVAQVTNLRSRNGW